MALVDALSRVYASYGLDVASPSRTAAQTRDEKLAQRHSGPSTST